MAKVREQPNARLTGRTPLLTVFALRFLAWVDEADIAPKTKAYYHNGWRLLSTTPVARMRLADIGDEQVSRIRANGSPASANNARRTLRRMVAMSKRIVQLLKQRRRGKDTAGYSRRLARILGKDTSA